LVFSPAVVSRSDGAACPSGTPKCARSLGVERSHLATCRDHSPRMPSCRSARSQLPQCRPTDGSKICRNRAMARLGACRDSGPMGVVAVCHVQGQSLSKRADQTSTSARLIRSQTLQLYRRDMGKHNRPQSVLGPFAGGRSAAIPRIGPCKRRALFAVDVMQPKHFVTCHSKVTETFSDNK
jgi:hypothetical protein